MTNPVDIHIAFEADEDLGGVREAIRAGLRAFNRAHVGDTQRTELAIAARTPSALPRRIPEHCYLPA